jgi:hypothetical protein
MVVWVSASPQRNKARHEFGAFFSSFLAAAQNMRFPKGLKKNMNFK